MNDPRARLEQLADRMASEIEPDYSQCRLTVGEFREIVAEIRAIADTLPAGAARG